MIGALASLLIVLAASLLVGQALAGIAAGATRERPAELSWMAPAFGIAALVVICGVAVRLPGHGITATVALLAAALAGALFCFRRTSGVGEAAALGLPVVAITVLAASLPFAIAGNVGILGVGLVNDDMASHLIIADYISDPGGVVPSFIKGGYPIGPHAVVVGLSELTGAGLVDAFAGFTVALAPLFGLVGIGLLDGMPRARRIVGASLVALPYLGAAYLLQGAFKEPLQALILVGFAISLAGLLGMDLPRGGRSHASRVHPIRRVLPLGVLAAASVFNYSLPGLLWIGAVTVCVLGARLLLIKPRPSLPDGWVRKLAPYAAGVVLVLVLATAQEWSRIADFSRLSALNPDRFGSDLGNLRGALSPLEALGIWPSSDFRISATAASLPAIVFYSGAAAALAGLALGLIRSSRERNLALPGALLAVLIVWGVAALFSSPYIAAKALAIAAPLAMAIVLRGTLGARGPALALGIVIVLAGALSTFLVLRQAPVGPDSHSDQLAEIRADVQDERVLFLGRDDFIRWELRGSDEVTGIVTNFYDVEDARPRFKKGEGGGEKFDVDAVFPATLDSFDFVLATTGGPASVVPPRFREVTRTDDYVLYERTGLVGRRKTLDEGIEPGAVLDCSLRENRQIALGRGTAVTWPVEPVLRGQAGWGPNPQPTDGRPSSQILDLPEAGSWLISIEYASRRPLRVTAPEVDLDTTIAANLDFRGETPFFPVAEIEVNGPTELELTVEPEEPNALASLLRAPNQAFLGSVSATPRDEIAPVRTQKRKTCGEYVDWYRAR